MVGSGISVRLAAGAWLAVLVVTLACLSCIVALETTDGYQPVASIDDSVSNAVLGLLFGSVGGLIATRRAGNLVGWSLLLGGLGISFYYFAYNYGELALLARPGAGLPAGIEVVAGFWGSWTLLVAGIFLLLLLFPNGVLPPRRWRWVAIAVPGALALVWLITIVYPEFDPPFEDFENPFAITNNPDHLAVMFPLIVFSLASMLAAGVALIVRFWRSTGEEREQFKWLAFGAFLLIVTFPVQGIHPIVDFVGGLAFLALPVAVGIAVLKYRLYDIDLLINRTLVYVPLTAVLAGVFVASTTLIRAVFEDLTEAGSDAAIAVSTITVVALLTPIKNKLQALVDRYFKEERSPSQQVRKQVSDARQVLRVLHTEGFISQFLDEMNGALGARGSSVELHDGSGALRFSGEWERSLGLQFPLRFKEETLGLLIVGPRRDGRPYRSDEVEAVEEAASVLAMAVTLSSFTPAGATLGRIGTA